MSGDYAFVADDQLGLQIIDITNPAAPALLGSYDTVGDAYDVCAAGDYAFVADGAAGLHVIDIMNPASPSLLPRRRASIPPPEAPKEVTDPRYLDLVGDHEEHPGTGKGPGAQQRAASAK